MAAFENNFHVYVGGKSGVFKGARLGLKECATKNIQNLVTVTPDDQVTALNWGDDEENEVLIACGIKGNRSVKVYETESGSFTSSLFCNIGKGGINGISRYDGAILTAVESGEVKLWRFKEEDAVLINAGADLKRMRHSKVNRNIIATGGQEHPLQLFDLQSQKRVFVEKNLPNDQLQLKIPLWISDIHFLPGTELITTCGRYGHIRMYDTRAQRRPVIRLEMKDHALTAMSTTPRELQIIVGSGTGKMNLIDVRAPGKILNTYREFTGGITGIACTQEPYIVSVGLDRFLHVHHLNTNKQVKKVYMSSKLSCLLVKSDFSMKTDDENEESLSRDNNIENSRPKNGVGSKNGEESDEEYNSIFDKMQIIGSKPVKKDVVQEKEAAENSLTETDVSNKVRRKNRKLGRAAKKLKTTINEA